MKNLTDIELIRQFTDTTFEGGYQYRGDNLTLAANVKSQELQQELERRLFEGRQALAELERVREALAGAGIPKDTDQLEWPIIYLVRNRDMWQACFGLADEKISQLQKTARAWKKAAKGWRQAARESLDACRPALRVPLLGTLSSETRPEDFERFAAQVKGNG